MEVRNLAAFTLLNDLVIYRNILKDELFCRIIENEWDCSTAGSLLERAEEIGLEGDLVVEYIFYLLAYGNNIFVRTAERNGIVSDSLLKAAASDIVLLRETLASDVNLFKQPFMQQYIPTAKSKITSLQNMKQIILDEKTSPKEAAEKLCQYYKKYGYGIIADFMAFKWSDNKLVGVHSCDNITFDEIIGYERQKNELMANTETFLKGLPANNVLLYGERGTGKSSSVKAIINKYFEEGLRLVEVSRAQFLSIPAIMSSLNDIGKKFILYLDDLSFEEFEVEYKQLKSTLEGGIEAKPDNVLIYATSNRRNIIKEVWADNEGDELHRTDTINEKVSLADRFGLKVFFISPDQDAYFKIILEKAKKVGLKMTEEELKKEAIKWEMSHTGRSGRIAEQLITYLIGKGK